MEAVWLPHPGVWVAKGSNVPIALKRPDNIALRLGPINCSHNMKWTHMRKIMLCYVISGILQALFPFSIKQVGTPCWGNDDDGKHTRGDRCHE